MNESRTPTILSVSDEIELLLSGSITREFCRWLTDRLASHGGPNWWHDRVRGVISENWRNSIDKGKVKVPDDLDLYALLLVFDRNYLFLKDPLSLPPHGRRTVKAMMDVRGGFAHRPAKQHSREKLESFLAITHDFSKMTDLPQGVIEALKQIEVDLATVEDIRSAGIPASRPEVPLRDFFGDFDPTPSQDLAIDKLDRFLEDDDKNCFLLTGYAGTGKTTLIGALIEYLRARHLIPLALAPTGRAARVIAEQHGVHASTIHRHIYEMTDMREFRETDKGGDITYKFYFDVKNNDYEHAAVFIVDEASMISDVESESEFVRFGTGRLLYDLLDYINFDANDYKKKIIFIGDTAQLSPDGGGSPPALDAEYLRRNCNVTVSATELTDVKRQDKSSPILKNATEMRRLITSGHLVSFDFESDDECIIEVDEADLLEHYFNRNPERPSQHATIITFTNKRSHEYNEYVREKYFPGRKGLAVGDIVMVVRNNYSFSIDLFNGQVGKVVQVDQAVEVRNAAKKGERSKESTGDDRNMRFRKMTIEFKDVEDVLRPVHCMVIENVLQDSGGEVASWLGKTLYRDFRIRNPRLRPGDPLFRETLRNDRYFNALQIKYGYSITCHKAQGGEWKNVFINFAGKNSLNLDALRWSYTAITRASERIVAANALHHGILPPQQKCAVALGEATGASVSVLPVEGPLPEELVDAPEHVRSIYTLIRRAVGRQIGYISHACSNFLVRWELEEDGKRLQLETYFKKNKRVGSVKCCEKTSQETAGLLQKLKGQQMMPFASSEGHVEELEMRDCMQLVVAEVEKRAVECGIEVRVERVISAYKLRLRLEKKMDWAEADFDFNEIGSSRGGAVVRASGKVFKEEAEAMLGIASE